MIELSGRGESFQYVTLREGNWILEISITDNMDCRNGECYPGRASFFIQSTSAGTGVQSAFGVEEWHQVSPLLVSGMSLDTVGPAGRQCLHIECVGDWKVRLSRY